jgi:hypothetical protein
VTSLAAAALGAAVTAAIVARRRAAGQPGESPPDPPTHPRTALVPEPPRLAPPVEEPPTEGVPPAGDPVEEPPTGAAPADPDPTSAPPASGPDTGTPRVAGRGRARPVVVGLALVAVLAAVGLFVATRGDELPDTDVEASVTTSPEPTTTTVIHELSPQQAFAHAADRLVAGGSFGYAGTTSATDVSHVRPGLWLAVDLTVEGEVETSAESVHEIAVDGDGRATETVTAGPVVWGRLATSRESLGDATYLPITEESGGQWPGKGAALLPAWLDSTVDRQDAGTDGRGHRVLRATLPASVLGEVVDGRPAGDASVLLTLDAAGDPVRVEVTSVPTAPPLRLALDLLRIGEPVVIDLPADTP